jgi:hypothetical protein
VDTKQFIASLVGSLAWPAAAVAIALLFRKQIVDLLNVPLKRLRVGPVELEFRELAARAVAQIVPATIEAAEAPTLPRGAEIEELARTRPSSAVLETSNEVEGKLRELLRAGGNPAANDSSYGLRMLARRAYDSDLINRQTVNALENIAELRNLAAHGDVTQDDAMEFLGLIELILFVLEGRLERLEGDDADSESK